LQFILDYKDHQNQPLEDMLCRSFTVDVDNYGLIEEVELIPGGKDVLVTR